MQVSEQEEKEAILETARSDYIVHKIKSQINGIRWIKKRI